MPDDAPTIQTQDGRFAKTLVRVLVIQVIALVFLWILQARYGA